MDDFVDYFELLGVTEDADERTIRRAYRTKALRYHPDKNPGNQHAGKLNKNIKVKVY
jgi:curved DNA-binding protein CbpA